MRVVMVTPYPPKRDGIGDHTRALVHELNAIVDVDVDVLTSRSPGSDVAPGVHRLLSIDPRSIRRSIVMMRDVRPDVIHLQFAIPALGLAGLGAVVAGIAIRRELGTRLVVTLHEVRRELDLLRGAGRLLYRILVSVADMVVVHTDEARELVVRECRADPSSVTLMPLGANPPSDDPVESIELADVRARYALTGRRVVLCFGYLHPDKGIEHLIEAAIRLRSRCADPAGFLVLIAGAVRPRTGVFRFFERADRAYESKLRRAVERSGISDRLRFVGFVPPADVPALFDLANALVMPCTSVTQSSVLGSAIAAGTPVVASDLAGIRESVGDGGILVRPGDPDALAEALDAVLFDDRVADDLRRRLRRRRRMINLGTVAETLCGVYRRLVAARATSAAMRADLVVDGG